MNPTIQNYPTLSNIVLRLWNWTVQHPYSLLIIGVIATSLAHMNFGMNFMGWFYYIPFILFLYLTSGFKSRLVFSLVMMITWTLVVLKITTEPIPAVMSFLFGIPIGLIHTVAFLIWSIWRKQRWAILLLPILLTIFEWIQYTFTPLASWGAAAYTQVDSLVLIQFVSVFGLAGLSFLLYLIQTSLASLLLSKKFTKLNTLLPIITFIFVVVYGEMRYDLSKSSGQKTIQVATIGTESTIGGLPVPTWEENEKDIQDIIIRTRKAASFGAKLIVWTEASCYLTKENESEWIQKVSEIAREHESSIVMSYVIPYYQPDFHYENKYVMINENGTVDQTYLKHEPVPGEPAIKGTSDLKIMETDRNKIGGAICYDYDYPYLAQKYGKLSADIIALPSSDWRGIDPIHTKMAAYRAVEQGHSVVRSTRFGLSGAINPYGELIGQASSFDSNSMIMVASLPEKGQTTIYSKIGDLFIYLTATLGIGLIGFHYIRKQTA